MKKVLCVFALISVLVSVLVLPVSATDYPGVYPGIFDGYCESLLPALWNDPVSSTFSISEGDQLVSITNQGLGSFRNQNYNFEVYAVMVSDSELRFSAFYFGVSFSSEIYRCNLENIPGTNIYFARFSGHDWLDMISAVPPTRCSVYAYPAERGDDFEIQAGIIGGDDFFPWLIQHVQPDPVLDDSSLGVLNNLLSVQIALSDADDLPDREVSLPLIRSTFGGFSLRPAEYTSDFYQYNSAVYDFIFAESFDFFSYPFYVTGQSYEMSATVYDGHGNQYAAHFALDDPYLRRGTLVLNDSSLSLPYLMTSHIRIDFSNPEDYAFGQYIIADASQAVFHSGYTAGYNDGSGDGYSTGYAEGQLHPTDDVLLEYTESVRDDIAFEAFERGKQQGIATKVDFPGLIFAVVDTPIQVISNVLNFDIFGYNMSYFFFGLLTLALFAALLRRIL